MYDQLPTVVRNYLRNGSINLNVCHRHILLLDKYIHDSIYQYKPVLSHEAMVACYRFFIEARSALGEGDSKRVHKIITAAYNYMLDFNQSRTRI